MSSKGTLKVGKQRGKWVLTVLTGYGGGGYDQGGYGGGYGGGMYLRLSNTTCLF